MRISEKHPAGSEELSAGFFREPVFGFSIANMCRKYTITVLAEAVTGTSAYRIPSGIGPFGDDAEPEFLVQMPGSACFSIPRNV